ncbi:caspase family protein [Lyngbya confervoides]|uniref:Caspase family protein n=1 Tax=Lyngbya confervoides BDU141951 TaxID=1574623 RepID=A0ABD4T2H2_9CYAN|nr:caspase family protein [Lyngbya confervoides]MCM1982437.1 caspase family protein [Lyngbya confervoides BDU141951]
MSLTVGQLLYASFPGMGCRVVASRQVPANVKQAFVEDVVHQHWDADRSFLPGYRAAYLHQVSPEHTLFGWMYQDDIPTEVGRSSFPYFVCYHCSGVLDGESLETIFHCLEKGPVDSLDTTQVAVDLARVAIPDTLDYRPAQQGVKLPSSSYARCRLLLYKGVALNFFYAVEPDLSNLHGAQDPATSEFQGAIPDSDPAQERALALRQEQSALDLSPAAALIPASQQKVALVIGVSDYGEGFNPLPGVLQDVAAIQSVLEHPDMGGFDQVQVLINPDPQAMAEAIEGLFANRESDHLALLYFSGYGAIVDEQGKFSLATGITRSSDQGRVIRSTVITTDFLDDVMRSSHSEQQLVILDCALQPSGAGVAQGSLLGPGQIAKQLGGPKRTILTSSAFSHPPEVDKGSEEMSAYTFYLVEGLQTGMADLNSDGHISVREWHEYAKYRVRQASPALTPSIYGDRSIGLIQIATAPTHSPLLRYRREVDRLNRRGQLPPAHRTVLDVLKETLGLSTLEAEQIEVEVFKPHREYHQKLQQYAIAFAQITKQGTVLTEQTYRQCQQAQRRLGLTYGDKSPIEADMVQELEMIRWPQTRPALPTQDPEEVPQTAVSSPFEKLRHQLEPILRLSQVKLLTRAKQLTQARSFSAQDLLRQPWMLVGMGLLGLGLILLILLRPWEGSPQPSEPTTRGSESLGHLDQTAPIPLGP